jgi:hypothetical protein
MTETLITASTRISAENQDWTRLKAAATAMQALQVKDGSIPDAANHGEASLHVGSIVDALRGTGPRLSARCRLPGRRRAKTFAAWEATGFAVPDFLSSLLAFQPQEQRQDGLQHLVVFPMYTQNGSSNRLVEAVLIEVIWPEFIAGLEAAEYSNKLFVPIRFLDFTAGYDTNSAVLFPETVAVSETPTFTWGAIFADREAARFRRVLKAAAETTRLELPAGSGGTPC